MPQEYDWYSVESIKLSEKWEVAANSPKQAATIIGKKTGIFVDPQDVGTKITKLGPVEDFSKKKNDFDQELIEELSIDKDLNKDLLATKWQCSHCGYSDPNHFQSSKCPNCDALY